MNKFFFLAVILSVTHGALVAQPTTMVSVNTAAKAQTIAGFGAATAYFDNWLTAHPKKVDLYNLIFSDLKLGILRIRNVHGYPNSSLTDVQEIVQQANTSLGHPVDVLISSWSPPASLKANGLTNGGTLLRTNGQFVTTEFAQWWYDSLQSYAAAGIQPTYISMQNEPDYENTGWDTSVLTNVESVSHPGYGVALQALSTKLQSLANRPKILGPEVTGIGFNNFQNYADNLNRNFLDGYAYHLYNGGDANNPDTFNANLTPLKVSYSDKPNIMTEFSGGTWFTTAWLIQNCLVNGNAAGYLYWDLIWGRPYGTGGLISLENPWDTASWTTATGYVINPQYYALKHFSKFITKGYTRVDSSTGNTNVRSSAFLSPDGSELVEVLVNIGPSGETAGFAFSGFTAVSGAAYQSVDNNYFSTLAAVVPGANVNLPGRSVTTIEFAQGSVLPISVIGVSVSPTAAALSAGSTVQLSSTIAPGNATNQSVTWRSSNPAVATVSANGLVSGVGAGMASITVISQDGAKTAVSGVTVSAASTNICLFGTPLSAGLPNLSATYSKVFLLGSGGPNLNNITNFTINWNLSLNGLWQLSMGTNNGQPDWWRDLRTVATWKFNSAGPEITFTNSGYPGLDGSYWVAVDGVNFALVSKNRGFSILFTNSTTPPTCR